MRGRKGAVLRARAPTTETDKAFKRATETAPITTHAADVLARAPTPLRLAATTRALKSRCGGGERGEAGLTRSPKANGTGAATANAATRRGSRRRARR